MNYNNYNTGYYQMTPCYSAGAVPDMLSQYKGAFQPQILPQYQPQMSTHNSQMNHQLQNSGDILWVQGEAGAKAFLVAPGNTIMLMDSEGERFYLKSADANGMPMPLRIFEYKEITEQKNKQSDLQQDEMSKWDDRFITREEFECRIASINTGCKCKENTTKTKEDKEDAEPVI